MWTLSSSKGEEMIRQGGQNIGFMFCEPGYEQCRTCRHMPKATCIAPLDGYIIGEDLLGECSGYRWSFIKWIKGIIYPSTG